MSERTIPRQLGAILDVLGLEWKSLFGEDNKDAGTNRNQVVSWLYRILDTLDNKTAHLLRFAALLLAAQTFLAGVLVRADKTPGWLSIVVLFLLLCPLATAVFALWIFRVEWPFFGNVRKEDKDRAD